MDVDIFLPVVLQMRIAPYAHLDNMPDFLRSSDKSVDDLSIITGLRVKFAEEIFNVLIETVNTHCQ